MKTRLPRRRTRKEAAKPGEEKEFSGRILHRAKGEASRSWSREPHRRAVQATDVNREDMHGCIKKFLKDIDNPEEADIESLCTLLKIIGQSFGQGEGELST